MRTESGNPPVLFGGFRNDRDGFPGLATPEADRVVLTLRREQPVRREGNHLHIPSVPFERADQPAAARVPQLHGFVVTPAGEHPTLRLKRDGSYPVLVPFECAKQLAASRSPKLHRPVVTPTGKQRALWIKRHAR